MTTDPQDFAEATAFELFALSELCPVLEKATGASIDLRGGKTIAAVKISITEDMSQGAIDETRDKLLPLLFGAAWKILDLAVELSLSQAGLRPRRSIWSIVEKVQHSRSGAYAFSSLACASEVSSALASLYAATEEHRHCIVHRTAEVNSSNGDLTGKDRNGQTIPPLSRAQQIAFAKAMTLVCRGIAANGIEPRSQDHLKYELDQLTNYTGVQPFGVGGADAPVCLELDAGLHENMVTLNIDAAMARARSVFPTVAYFNVVAHLSDGSTLQFKAEDAQTGENLLNINQLPIWVERACS